MEQAFTPHVVELVTATRENEYIELGVSPRGALALCRMAKSCAFVRGRDYVIPEDVAAVFDDVCCHRLVLSAKARLHRLQALLLEQQVAFNASQAGRVLPVLFEKKGRHGAQAIGRSPYLQSVHVEDADHLIGRIVPVEIVSGQQNSLTGRLTMNVLNAESKAA